ncbi:hypothetical protein LEP1GSC168_0484 [Leptospira santarosai str. HAI134]|nr:hypothetical protein LEP1GSC168_0484 [Leptospira santarosai str. HAI134]
MQSKSTDRPQQITNRCKDETNKFTKIQFDIADDGITNRSTIGGKAWVFEPVSNTCKNRNLIGKLKTLQAVSAKSLSKNLKNLIQKLRLSEFLQQTLDEETNSDGASIPKRQNLWELPQQTLDEETDSNRASNSKETKSVGTPTADIGRRNGFKPREHSKTEIVGTPTTDVG